MCYVEKKKKNNISLDEPINRAFLANAFHRIIWEMRKT